MKIFEFIEQNDIDTAVYDPSQDQVSNRVPNDVRKTKLSLRHLNRLKRIRALDRLEKLKREDLFGVMYSLPDEQEGGMGGPPGF